MDEKELNDKWSIHAIIQEAIKASHIKPSPETTQRLKGLEEKHTKVMEKIDNIEEKVNKISIDIATLPEKILEKADERFASKTTERIVYTLVGSILLVVIYAILDVVVTN